MSNKIIKQLTQFKCYHFEEWQSQSNYIPLAGEICGFIILNDEELKGLVTQDLIPNGYEGQKTPYTLMKMGDGITTIMELPWAGLTDENVVNQLIDNLFKTEGNENAQQGIIGEINKHIAESVADWGQNDPAAYDYIKNRICSATYNLIPEDEQETMGETIVSLEQAPEEYQNLYFGTLELGNITEALNVFNEMDKFQVNIYHSALKDYKNFTSILHRLGSVSLDSGETIIYGLGNTSIFTEVQNKASAQFINLSGEITNDPYGLIFMITTDSETLERYATLIFYCSSEFVQIDESGNITAILKLTHIEKCVNINPISSRWLPQSIKAHADWNALSYEDPGYIKNRICSVIAYEDLSKKYFTNKITYFNVAYSNLMLSDAIIITNFGEVNTLNKYKIKLNNQETISSFFEIQSINNQGTVDSEPLYLLGNVYLYVKFLYDLCIGLGIMPLFVTNLMSSIEDDGTDFCFICSPNENDLGINIMYRPAEEAYKGQSNIDLEYTLQTEGTVLQDNSGVMSLIYSENIFEEIKNNTNYFMGENEQYKYYIVFEDKGLESPYEIKSYGQNSDTQKYYIEFNENPGYTSGTVISNITIIREDAIKYTSFSLKYSPYQIKTIDPVWIPAELKVGQYEDYNAYDISAEIFNDYNNNHAYGSYSHAEGYKTIANGNYQHVQGKFNKVTEDTNNSIAFIIGNGTDETKRSNAYTLDFDGNSIQQGEANASDFVSEDHRLSQKENSINKVKHITQTDNEEFFPTSQAVIEYFNSMFFSKIDDQGNITLNIGSIDGNGLYGNPFIDK